MERNLEKIKAVMLGHAVGDALGVPVEFCSRAELDQNPVTDMRGFGTYPVPAGAWSDDTSMSIAALDAMCKKHWSYEDVMKNFALWLEKGKYTPTGRAFDVGCTCRCAISNYTIPVYGNDFGKAILPPGFDVVKNCGLNGERSNGNGSMMRIHPFVLYADAKMLPFQVWKPLIENASALTHAHERSIVGCLIYAFVLMHLLNDSSKSAIELALRRAEIHLREYGELSHYGRIFEPDFANIPQNGIKSSGYVVDTLEAALWCSLTTDSYRECVLKAVNLGEDTDTVAAIAGGLAGVLYGYEAIPTEWLDTLLRRDKIEAICERAAKTWSEND